MARENSQPPGPAAGLQNFNQSGQNRESGGSEAEKTPYAAESGIGESVDGSGPDA